MEWDKLKYSNLLDELRHSKSFQWKVFKYSIIAFTALYGFTRYIPKLIIFYVIILMVLTIFISGRYIIYYMTNAVVCSDELDSLAKKYHEINDESLERSIDYFVIIIPIALVLITFTYCSIIIIMICVENGKSHILSGVLSEFIGLMINFSFSFICMILLINVSEKTFKGLVSKWIYTLLTVIGSCLGIYNDIGGFS